MCEACRYPREFSIGQSVETGRGKGEILKQYAVGERKSCIRGEEDPSRKWYRVRLLEVIGSDPEREIDLPCNVLCSISPEGNKRIYSRFCKCYKCEEMVRLSYPETAGVNGHWTCPKCGAKYPFMFWKISKDAEYTEEMARATDIPKGVKN